MPVRKQIFYPIAAVYLAAAASCVNAQPLESQQRVLNAITAAADRICNVIKIDSPTERVKGTAAFLSMSTDREPSRSAEAAQIST